MSFGILNTFLGRLERYGEAHVLRRLAAEHIALAASGGRYSVQATAVPVNERPPMIEIPEYAARFPPNARASYTPSGPVKGAQDSTPEGRARG
jgi:hypothetical protein